MGNAPFGQEGKRIQLSTLHHTRLALTKVETCGPCAIYATTSLPVPARRRNLLRFTKSCWTLTMHPGL